MSEQTWKLTVVVSANAKTFTDLEDHDELLEAIQAEIVASLDERGASAAVVDVVELVEGE